MNDKIVLRLSRVDKEYLQQEADKMRIPLSTYVRSTILSKDDE